MQDNQNYYGILPANVRYDKNLSPQSKLLYVEITALCQKEGYCWATNEYFCKIFTTSRVTLNRWMGELIKSGFIHIDIQQKNTRKIWIILSGGGCSNMNRGMFKYEQGGCSNMNTPLIGNNIKEYNNIKEGAAAPDEVTKKFEFPIPKSLADSEKFMEVWADWEG